MIHHVLDILAAWSVSGWAICWIVRKLIPHYWWDKGPMWAQQIIGSIVIAIVGPLIWIEVILDDD